MIDAEFAIYNVVSNDLEAAFPGIYVTGEVSYAPSKFPAVSIVEKSNSIFQRMRTAVIENAVSVMYEVNIYSNKIGYSKMEAKSILAAVDDSFTRLGFTRTFSNPVQNLEDSKIFRIVARYEAVIDRDFTVYQN